MSFTRFHDDPNRIKKELQQSTDPGRYILNVPGNGPKPCFMMDPYMRMQKWGANLMTNSINLESELLGLNKPLNRDNLKYNYNNQDFKVNSQQVVYPNCVPFTEQTRATNPAWTALDAEIDNTYPLFLNPQANVCIPFQNNLNSRILEKDYFVAKPICPLDKIN